MVRRSRISEEIKLAENNAASKITYPSISYFTLYRFSSKCDRRLIAIALVASFIAAISLPYAITLVASTFQSMISYAKEEKSGQEADAGKFLRQMHRFGVLYSCVGVLIFTGGYLGSALMNITAINQIYKIREAYLRAALNQDFAYFDLYQTGDFASKMADDIIKLEEGIGEKVSALVYNLTIAVACVSMALYKGWKLALMCLTTAPVTFILVGLTGMLATRLSKKEALSSGRASSIAQEVLGSIRTVYTFNGQQKELRRYKEPLAQARKIKIKKEFFTGLSMGFLFFCIFGSYALSFYWGIYLVINDPQNYNADVMFSVFFGVMTGMGNLGMIGSLVGSFGSARGAGAQIFHLIDNVPTINPLLDRGLKPHVEGNIELKNVVFKYPSRSTISVLDGVSLKVNRGQSVALVGHSGSGKSTIISLISRYYDVLDGSVRVDGYDVRDLSVSWLRAHIGLVSQEPILFNTSVRENIRYGHDAATDDDVEDAAKKANAHNFIVKLPKGYNTHVGERGASLSGGQKQRIAIARALVRNPRILLLDEATSALDMSSEAKVQKALEKAAEGRTTITVAHRLSTIRNVDLIYVMKNGNVVETGTHEQLMRNRSHYYYMLIAQEPNTITGTKEVMVPVREDSDIEEVGEKADTISILDERSDVPEVRKLSFWSVIRLNSPEWKSITIGCLGSIFIGFSLPLFIIAFGDMFGAMSVSDPGILMDKGRIVALNCIVIGVVMGISNLVECLSFGIAGAYLTERLRGRMFSHMLQQHIGFFDERTNSTGALCARLSAEAAYVQGATGQRIGIFLQGLGSIGLALVLAMLYQWKVGLVAVSFFPIIAVIIYHQAKETGRESQGNAISLENSTKVAMEAVSNIRAVASLGRERLFLSEYTAQLTPTLRLSRRAAHCRGVITGMSRSMFNFINAAALTYGGHLIVSEGVAYDNILVTTQSLQMASGQLQNAFTFAPDFQKGINAASRIVIQLKQKPKIVDPPVPEVVGFVSKGQARLQYVDFRYPTRPKQQVLRGLNLQVDSGKTVAVVGASGCGKSTVIQLLQRFYDPEKGVVYLDNHPVPQLRLAEVRSSFGLVSQEPVLFALSIKENIAYGDNSREPTMVDIVEAARQANIHDFIVSLPEGYETNIGSKGVQISGGQKQRVAIARALIRKPKILLLDEATSALDSESERVVLQALETGRCGRTCIVIAHRLTTVRDADIIYVIDAGRAVETGTHDQLVQANGVYARLYHAGV